ncbi:hypothetical protein C5B85_07050 [Pseudoclavibacter sp. AY1F1]|nr:hypothetical protein C5B85_07050 [Pseudoclavibacter sp. AY1F1]
MSRYYSYVQGNQQNTASLTGDAGEVAFHEAFLRASVGSSLAEVTRGIPAVPRIMGMQVDLDNAFVLNPLDSETRAPIPPFGVQALVEVKNIREWIYPRTQELYQVLHKAAQLQCAFPDNSFLPVLVCRRTQITTVFMAKSLGFYVIDARQHYFPEHSHIDPANLQELVSELALTDITQGNGAEQTRHTQNRLVTLQRHFDVLEAIEKWKRHAQNHAFRELLKTLNNDRITNVHRDASLNQLRRVMQQDFGAKGGW